MKKLKITLLVFFIIVSIVFGIRWIRNYLTKDVKAPEITADKDTIEVSVDVTDEELLKGMKASDNRDGDVTHTLVVVSKSKFIEPGVLKVNYAAFDSHNNVGTFSRKLVYTDYTRPQFSMKQPMVVRQSSSSYDILEGVRAEDCIDGDITGQVRMTYENGNSRFVMTASDSEVTAGIELSVTNSVGDTISVPVHVRYLPDKLYDQAAPALSEYLVYTTVGKKVKLRSYIEGIWYAGNTRGFGEGNTYSKSDVKIVSDEPDYNTPGVYEVEFRLRETKVEKDEDGEEIRTKSDLGSNILYVVVEE
ncbi:MAG: hypothetical protein Q4B22_02200 [Eubacteriales bacterium]|nr:hypothetical protein [Eubacteriales bacterium]